MDESDGFIKKVKYKVANLVNIDNNILDECTITNIKRAFYLSMISIPLRILNILLFLRDDTSPPTWKTGIIVLHSSMFVFWVIIHLISRIYKNRTRVTRGMVLFQYLVIAGLVLFGVAIVAVDQLITTNITPFLLTIIVLGTVFLLKPLVSASVFLSSYLLFFSSMAFTTSNTQILLSSRANGLTISAIGFVLSVIIWNYNSVNINQRHSIEKQRKQLQKMAYYDHLTNLPNRYLFNNIVEDELSLMSNTGHKSVLILLDIHDFNGINDSHGFMVGDQLLVKFSRFLSENIRKTDTAARFGGVEFIILAPDTDLAEGIDMAKKLKADIENTKFTVGPLPLNVTVSFGVSLLKREKHAGNGSYFSSIDEALRLARNKSKTRESC